MLKGPGSVGVAPLGGVIFGLVALLNGSEATAQQVTWSTTQISNVNGDMPSVEVDRLGYVHVGWTLNLGGSSYYAYHASNASGDYGVTLVDSKTTGSPSPYFPFLTTDTSGFFHMVWRELSLTGKPVFYRTNNPTTRALVKMSFGNAGHSHDPIVDVTSDDIAHVMTEADSCTGCPSGSNLYDESFATTSAFAGRVTTLAQDLNDATGAQQFSSAVTPNGTRHAVVSMRLAPPADNQRLIYYASRPAGSPVWSTPVSITGHEDNGQGWPGIVSDASGVLHVVYASGDYGIYYVNNRTGSWSTPLRINDQNTVMDTIPSVTIDPNGRLHVAFLRYTPRSGQPALVSLQYTTNAFDADNWLDPVSQILGDVGTFTLTHQNRKIAVNWVDGQVVVPYMEGSRIWLASTTDVPVTPVAPPGTGTLTTTAGFTPPAQINRGVSIAAASATSILKFKITDGGGDAVETRISAVHLNAGPAQSYTVVSGKDEGLSYLLAGAQLVTGSGQTINGVIADTKIVFADANHYLWVPTGGTQTYDVKIWMKNVAQVTGKTINLHVKPDQDVAIEFGGTQMMVDQAWADSGSILIVDNNAQCPTGTACDDGNPCTFMDMCSNSNVCVGLTVTCNSDPCNARTCNGTSTCTTTPISCGGGTGSGGASMGGMSGGVGGKGAGGMGGGGTGGSGAGGRAGAVGSGGMMVAGTGGVVGNGGQAGVVVGATGGAGMPTGGTFGGSGGVTASGGAVGTGGAMAMGTGGVTVATGGVSAGGGATATGGMSAGGAGGAPDSTGSGGTAVDAGAAVDGAAPGNEASGASGCSCEVSGTNEGGWAGIAMAVLLVAARRRRSAARGRA